MLPVSTQASLLFFGSLMLSYGAYRIFRFFVKNSTTSFESTELTARQEGLVHGEESLNKLGKASFELGLLSLITWLSENRPIFEHSNKTHDMDLFTLIILTAFIFAWLFSFHIASTDQGILNRDQTEEWRGFMQMVFLLYHYFALEEVYPLIRLFISCYVFLTGFGNTSFFYLKRDYSMVRLLSMLWRLCFSCIVLAMVHNNPIILYYIVPLHTCYFLISYVTMSLFEKRVNYTRHGLQIKLLILGCIIFIIWEFPPVFEVVFSFLSNEPHPGAPVGAYGTRYEWQFRSGLDHYSSFFGMVFACGFPMLELRETNVLTKSNAIRVIVALMFTAGALYWCFGLYPLPKFQYNARHAYTFIFPMCCYLFLRNLTPYLRRVHLGMFAFAGKYTLETYLLQHHVWLTSNAKTVLVLIPGFPKTNFLIVSAIYFMLSIKLYDLTVRLKSLLIPSNDASGAIRNCIVLAGIIGFCFSTSEVIALLGNELLVTIGVTSLLAIGWILLGMLFVKDNGILNSQLRTRVVLTISIVFIILGVLCSYFPLKSENDEFSKSCNANHGDWVKEFDGLCGQSPQVNYAYCSTRGWAWNVMDQKHCGWKKITKLDNFDKILIVGGSEDTSLALSLASIHNPFFKYSDKNPTKELADGKVKLVNEIPSGELTDKSLVLCQKNNPTACDSLLNGIGIFIQNSESEQILGNAFVVKAYQVKNNAPKADILTKDVFRQDVYDVIVQIALNQAVKEMKKDTKGSASAPPPGGISANPLYGLGFLLIAFFALFLSDGYLGLVAICSLLAGYESAVSWQAAVEKVHSKVPGLFGESAPIPMVVRVKDPEHLSDGPDEVETLVASNNGSETKN